MKQKKLLSLGVTLLLALSQLFAQNQQVPLSLKSGDWFDTGIRIRHMALNSDYNFKVRYDLSSKAPDGVMVFKVSIERMQLKYADTSNNWFGYDSYYPRYLENRKKNLTKQIYELRTDSHGKISKLTTLSAAQQFNFSLINISANTPAPKTVFSSESVFPTEDVKKISEAVISHLLDGKQMPKTLHLSQTNAIANIALKSGTFKLPANAVIKGKITNLASIDTLYAVDQNIFRFSKDGSFSADVLAGLTARQRWIFGQFDEFKTFSILLEPSDTLIVNADAQNFDNTLSFSGKAAAKAALSKDLVNIFDSQWVNESHYRSKSMQEFLAFQKKGLDDFNNVINKYANRVSAEFLNYCRTDFNYVRAGTKLQYLSHNQSGSKPKIALDEFPQDFFVSIDTLPVSMSGLEGGLYYNYYLTWLLSYKQTKLGMVNAKQYGFLTNYATAMASLNGFPLHYSIYNSLKNELHKSEVESTERLQVYYKDFINNCGDTLFTNRIKKEWAQARRWLPGNPSPAKQLILNDGSTLDLTRFKGKPLAIILNLNSPEALRGYIDLIKKQNGDQVHFLIVQSVSEVEKSTARLTLMELPNVTYVETTIENVQKNFKLYYLETKIYTFNSDYRILSSYLFDSSPDDQVIVEEMIKTTIDSTVMTKEQKAQMMKTIGWSLGSILFASLIFFWVYKARISNIKRKESLKRQIKDLEIKAIRSQMNPHFMFNALNSIQSLINNDRYNEANIYLEKFALLMRRVLNNSEKTFITLSDELEAITLYCDLEQLRFSFKYEIEISPEVNTQLTEIPGMIIQPLVENSILHGLAQKGESGLLSIRISADEQHLKIVVRDNGTGLKENVAKNKESFGLKLVRERLSLLSADTNAGNLFLVSNLGENETGVTAVLTLPIG